MRTVYVKLYSINEDIPEAAIADVTHCGEVLELHFSDGNTKKVLAVRGTNCEDCYIAQYSDSVDRCMRCPDSPIGIHLCTDLKDVYCVFKPLDNLMEDI